MQHLFFKHGNYENNATHYLKNMEIWIPWNNKQSQSAPDMFFCLYNFSRHDTRLYPPPVAYCLRQAAFGASKLHLLPAKLRLHLAASWPCVAVPHCLHVSTHCLHTPNYKFTALLDPPCPVECKVISRGETYGPLY